jgi:hypothetical protein
MTYIDDITAALKPMIPETSDELLRMYALLALVKGEDCTLEDVHDAWAAYTIAKRPDHRSIVPFGELTPAVQAYDEPFLAGIHSVAAEKLAWRRHP